MIAQGKRDEVRAALGKSSNKSSKPCRGGRVQIWLLNFVEWVVFKTFRTEPDHRCSVRRLHRLVRAVRWRSVLLKEKLQKRVDDLANQLLYRAMGRSENLHEVHRITLGIVINVWK